MEIERKFLIHQIPYDIEKYDFRLIEQAYLCTSPVVRVRRDNDDYYLTYKSSGLLMREEYNLPLTMESYCHLVEKADGNIISKKRYMIPLDSDHTIEFDIFEGKFQGLMIAEVEFSSKEDADSFIPPDWFDEEVTYSTQYHNSTLSMKQFD